MFVISQCLSFQPSRLFASKAGAYLSETLFIALQGTILALPTNTRY